jgi:cell division protein FtsL
MAMAGTPSAPEAMAFSVPKDIQNHPVRNVDRARQREMWWSVAFVSLLVGALLLVAWEHSQWTHLGYEMARLQKERSAGEAENRHLRLELETLRSPQAIEALAIRELHMVAPTQTEAVVLELVREAATPARSLVARR